MRVSRRTVLLAPPGLMLSATASAAEGPIRFAVALANGQVDCAWMCPWGYLLARDRSGAEPLVVVDYQGKPIYDAVITAQPGLKIDNFPAKDIASSQVDLANDYNGNLTP